MKKISIVVPIYNVEDSLERCVMSLINQDFDEKEIILVDDGSTDKSRNLAQIFANEFKCVKLYVKKNGGLSDARNYGMNRITGDVLMFVDSDDYLEQNVLSELVVNFEQTNAQILIGNATVHKNKSVYSLRRMKTQDGQIDGVTFLKSAINENDYIPTVWTNLYSVSFLKKANINFKKDLLHEDEDWFPRIMLKAKRVTYINYLFYHYVIRENSITMSKNKMNNVRSKMLIADGLYSLYMNEIQTLSVRNTLINYLADMVINTSDFIDTNWKEYSKIIDRIFVIKSSKKIKTLLKGIIFVISPKMYSKLKKIMKKLLNKEVV